MSSKAILCSLFRSCSCSFRLRNRSLKRCIRCDVFRLAKARAARLGYRHVRQRVRTDAGELRYLRQQLHAGIISYGNLSRIEVAAQAPGLLRSWFDHCTSFAHRFLKLLFRVTAVLINRYTQRACRARCGGTASRRARSRRPLFPLQHLFLGLRLRCSKAFGVEILCHLCRSLCVGHRFLFRIVSLLCFLLDNLFCSLLLDDSLGLPHSRDRVLSGARDDLFCQLSCSDRFLERGTARSNRHLFHLRELLQANLAISISICLLQHFNDLRVVSVHPKLLDGFPELLAIDKSVAVDIQLVEDLLRLHTRLCLLWLPCPFSGVN